VNRPELLPESDPTGAEAGGGRHPAGASPPPTALQGNGGASALP
jgi:hypothetical protein